MTIATRLAAAALAALTLAGCRGSEANTNSDSGALKKARAYADEIDALQKAGKLAKFVSDRDGCNEPGMIFWLRDGRLVKSERTAVEDAKLNLPPLEKVERLEFKNPESRDNPIRFTVTDRGQIALFYHCLRLASFKKTGARITYYYPDGSIAPCAHGVFGGTVMHECGLGLFLMSGGKEVYEVSGHEGDAVFDLRMSGEGGIVNRSLGLLLKQYCEAAKAAPAPGK